jgi:hypothetical protein
VIRDDGGGGIEDLPKEAIFAIAYKGEPRINTNPKIIVPAFSTKAKAYSGLVA